MDRFKRGSNGHNQRTEKTERNIEICRLRGQGMTNQAIGEKFGITMQMVSKIYHRDRDRYV